ncbi:hypothetical protein [Novosphingobium huizhouense]|uniref:hypothetical protein n=1 Tax=Novosphingobium huizhouense TaxID=2866625 RepID=UPI001CD8FEF9|nr:hypothetical protein [Novosphingobium huizhouense]
MLVLVVGALTATPLCATGKAHQAGPASTGIPSPPAPAAPPLRALAQVRLLVDLPRTQRAGARAAGMLCLPNGVVRVVDLVGGDAALEATVRAALARAGETRLRGGGDIEIHLTEVSVKLCARKWGAFGIGGDHGALSGEANYAFRWTRTGDAEPRSARIALSIDRHAPMTAGEITGRALDLLFDRIIPAA